MTLTIRNVPEKVYASLKRLAREHGRSLNAEVIGILTKYAEDEERRPFAPKRLEELRALRESLSPMPDSVPLIRAERRKRDRRLAP